VPELLTITPAQAVAEQPYTAQPYTTLAYAAQAVQRPLAGFGTGAFTCDGAWVGSRADEMTVGLALPRIRQAAAAKRIGYAQAGVVGAGHKTSLVSTGELDTKHFNLMTRINPVTPGGVGSHPAREPDPV
jgi:hypothetical protein